MILIKANLVAGSGHAKYAAGQSIPAILFVPAENEDEAEAIASRELATSGWATMTVEAFKEVTDYAQFKGEDSPEAAAFQDALASGFAVVVHP